MRDRLEASVVGTDSHAPDQLERRIDQSNETAGDLPVELVDYRTVVDR